MISLPVELIWFDRKIKKIILSHFPPPWGINVLTDNWQHYWKGGVVAAGGWVPYMEGDIHMERPTKSLEMSDSPSKRAGHLGTWGYSRFFLKWKLLFFAFPFKWIWLWEGYFNRLIPEVNYFQSENGLEVYFWPALQNRKPQMSSSAFNPLRSIRFYIQFSE